MKEIKLNPNNWIFRLQRFVYNYEPNEYERDGCKLGWQMIALTLVIALAYPTLILQKIFKERKAKTVPSIALGVLVQVVGLMVGVLTLDAFSVDVNKLNIADILWIITLGVVVTFIICLVMVGIVALTMEICELIGDKTKQRNKIRKDSFLKSWLKAKKEKSCPMVEWENKK